MRASFPWLSAGCLGVLVACAGNDASEDSQRSTGGQGGRAAAGAGGTADTGGAAGSAFPTGGSAGRGGNDPSGMGGDGAAGRGGSDAGGPAGSTAGEAVGGAGGVLGGAAGSGSGANAGSAGVGGECRGEALCEDYCANTTMKCPNDTATYEACLRSCTPPACDETEPCREEYMEWVACLRVATVECLSNGVGSLTGIDCRDESATYEACRGFRWGCFNSDAFCTCTSSSSPAADDPSCLSNHGCCAAYSVGRICNCGAGTCGQPGYIEVPSCPGP